MRKNLNQFTKISGALILMLILAQINVTAQNPVAHWKLDETTGTTAADELGSSDGTRTNMTDGLIVDGLDGKAVDFSLGDDTSFIIVPHNDIIDFDSTESFSISTLMYIPTEPEGGYNALLKGNTGVNAAIGAEGKWYTIEYKNGEIRFTVDDNVTKTQLGVNVSETYPLVGGWAHVVGVRDLAADMLYLYVNGKEIGSREDLTDNDIASTLPLIIGNNHNKNNNFPGTMDDVRIYDVALTAAQVVTLFESYDVPTRGLVAHWKLDETTGAAAADELGNSDGTRTNMTDALIVDGLDGKAVDFLSGDDTSYITVPHNDIIDFDSTESFSVSTLMYIPTEPEGGYNALLKGNTGVNAAIGAEGKWYTIEYKGGEIRFTVDDNVTKTQLGVNISETTPLVGGWAHVAGVRNLATDMLYLYLNGKLIGSREDLTDNDIASTLPLIIGNNHNKNNNFPGTMDELRLYNVALTGVEINELFESYDVPTRGLVAHWKLDETTGAAAADELGNSDGTRTNMTDALIVDGLDGKAVDFSSGDDTSYITVPHNDIIDFDSTESFSVSALMYIPEEPEGGYNALIKGNTGVNAAIGAEGKWYTIEYKGGEMRFTVDDNVTKTQLGVNISNTWPVVRGWTHVVGVRDLVNDSLLLYVNGMKIGSREDLTDNDIASTLPLIIGNNHNNNNNFPGTLDDVRLYNVALKIGEIQELYALYNPPERGLVAHWPIDEGEGTDVADVVGGVDGTIVGDDPPEWIDDGGLSYNDIDSNHVEVPDAAAFDFGDEDFSVSLLVRYDTIPVNTDRWLIKGTHGGDGTGSRYELFLTSGGTVRFSIDNGPDNIKTALEVPGAPFVTGDWVQVVAVRDTTARLTSLYANGVLLGTKEETSGDISSGEPMWIGESTDETNTAMSGDIKDVRLYNVCLTPSEINMKKKAQGISAQMVAHWPMDDGGGTTVADVVGGNDGTIVGDDKPEWIDDGGLAFNNIDSNHVEVPHADILDFADESFSVSMLVRYDTADGTTDRWIIKGTHGGDGTGSRYEIFKTSGGTVRFSIDNGPDNVKSALEVGGNAFWNGDWVHVVAVRNAMYDTMMIFANGAFQGGRRDNSGDISSGEDMWIGESTDETATAMSGDIKDVRIYNYAMSDTEVQEMFKSSGLRPPLVAHWPMDEGSGTDVADKVGGNDGEIVSLQDPPEWITGGGLSFSGIDSNHVEVPHADILDFADESFSVSMLVRYDQDAEVSTDRWIIKGTHGGDGTGSRYEMFRTSGGTVRFSIDNGPANIKSALEVQGMDYMTGDWVHVVAVRDAVSDTMLLYANAVFQGGRHDNSGDISSGEDMWIGESTDETATAMSGDMKDVRIYSYALSGNEITDLFESYNIQSADAYLTAITFDPVAALNPEFDKATFSYTGNLPAGTASANVTATASDANATVTGEGSVTVPGDATIEVTAANGITKRTYTVSLLATAIRDLSVSGLNVYPNPAANNLVIESEIEISSAYIYNSSGQLVKSVKDINTNTVDIDVSDLNSGLYLVNIIGVDADAVNFSFMKK